MNARSQVFELSVEPRQVEEAVLSIFHTVLFHRTLGKFTYQEESSYFVGTVGFEDVDCDYIDHTYVRTQSPQLCDCLKQRVAAFSHDLRYADGTTSNSSPRNGQVSLEFYQKKRRWPFAVDNIPWEVWTVKTELVHLDNEQERQQLQASVGDTIADKVEYICEVMNRHDYVPKMPTNADLDLVFDTAFGDVQPYLFNITYTTSDSAGASVGHTVRKLLKDTLAI